MMSNKKIIIGDIMSDWCQTADNVNYNINQQYTPVDVFKEVVRLYKSKKDFTIYTNNPQLIEAIEVLYTEGGEEPDIELYYQDKWGKLIQLNDFQEVYDYLGEPYDIIDAIRVARSFNEDEKDVLKLTSELIKEKKVKWIERLGL